MLAQIRQHTALDRKSPDAMRDAVSRAGFTEQAMCRTFRHSFAAHPLEGGCDIRTVRELLGRMEHK
jgi:site-specific recombinase XerD